MTRRFASLGLLALAGLPGLAACHSGEARETLLIAGSTTFEGYLQPVVAAYQKHHPNASIVSEPGGATAGIIALKRGAIDIATIAREVTAAEDDIYLRDYLVARDGMAIIVHPSNPIADVSLHQLAQIGAGQIKAWRDLAGDDASREALGKLGTVAFIDRPKDSHTRKSLLDLLFGGDDDLHGSKEVQSSAEMVDAVKADPRAIGFVPFRTLSENNGAVKALAIEHVPMTRATMLSGRYRLTRSFYLAVHRQPTKLAEDFVMFALSDEGQTLLEGDGLLGVR